MGQVYRTITFTTAVPHGLAVGQTVVMAGWTPAAFNMTAVVYAVGSNVTFKVLWNSSTDPGPVTITGTVTPQASTLIRNQNLVTAKTSAAHNFAAGYQVTIALGAGWDGTFFITSVPSPTTFTYQQAGVNAQTAAAGTATIVGQVAVGQRKCVLMFLTRQGALTAPSPPVEINIVGGQQLAISNLPIGPANVVARLLAFTPAGGGNYFAIPSSPPGGGTPTLIPDNTTTSAVVDFSDNTLQAAFAIDVAGNNLFDQVVLGPVAGFFAYASRLIAWGDYNKIENFLNLGFCGGYLAGVLTTPLGWTVATAGGTLVNGAGPWGAAMSWQITGDGSANPIAELTQPAYQDYLGNAIVSPSTQYQLRVWARASAPGLAGNLVVDIYSAGGGGVLASASVPIANIAGLGGFQQVNFTLATPAAIPLDTVLRVYEVGLNAGAVVTMSEIEIVFAVNPYRPNLARVSYTLNPEGFASTTGNLGPSDDDSPIRCFSRQRNSALLKTAEGTHIFQDNDNEPDKWVVNALSHSVGAVSLRAGDPGKFGTGDAAEDWDLTASKNGLFLFSGADFWKVSQEMSKGAGLTTAITWDDINWTAEHTIWVKNDPGTRRAYIGVPVKGADRPNLVFVLDYREMDTATQIASALPLHITLAGKMKSSDMTRKWSRWNISANCGEVLVRPGNQRTLFLGGGGNFGNIYSLDPTLLTDDDYGAISPYYTTYAFVDHDQEQGLQLGSARHLYSHISGFISGVGLVSITPLVNSLFNFLPALPPRLLATDQDAATAQTSDLEWVTGIRGQRVFFKIAVQPLPGTTDVQMKLQKMIVRMSKDPVTLYRGSGI